MAWQILMMSKTGICKIYLVYRYSLVVEAIASI